MMKSIQYSLFVMLFSCIGIDSLHATNYLKKSIKIAWNCAEVYAGWKISKHWSKRAAREQQLIYGVATVSLLFHGLYGLNKELKVIQRAKSVIK